MLFVDDDQSVLDSLKQALHEMQAEWQMTFSASGDDALRMFAAREFHVIVTDMGMPGMTGPSYWPKSSNDTPTSSELSFQATSSMILLFDWRLWLINTWSSHVTQPRCGPLSTQHCGFDRCSCLRS